MITDRRKKHKTLSRLSALTAIGLRMCTTSAVYGSRGLQPGRVVPVCCHAIYSVRYRYVDVPAGVKQEEGLARFLLLLSAVLALIFFARRIQSFLFLVDREVKFCVLTIQSFSTCWR
jgi:hypothetical protein